MVSVAQICVFLDSMIVIDLLQSLGRSYMFFICFLWWSSMISFNDRQWSPSMPQSPKYMSYLNSMLVNVLLKSFGLPNMFILFLWSSMISCKASVSQIYVLLRFSDRQGSLTKLRSLIYVFYLFSMIVNDLLQCLGRPNMCLFRLYDRQWSLTKSRSPKYVSYLD